MIKKAGPGSSKRNPGRKRPAAPAPASAPYAPKPGEAELVMLGVAVNAPEEAIMTLVGGGSLTRERFKAAFATELAHGKDIARIKVASQLYLMASSRMKGLAPTSAIYLMKMLSGIEGGANSATVTVKSQGETGAPASPDNAQIIEVSFKIGDDSKIKDEDG